MWYQEAWNDRKHGPGKTIRRNLKRVRILLKATLWCMDEMQLQLEWNYKKFNFR